MRALVSASAWRWPGITCGSQLCTATLWAATCSQHLPLGAELPTAPGQKSVQPSAGHVQGRTKLGHMIARHPPALQAFATMEQELGRPVASVFSSISDGPIAAASLGQVYKAVLRDTGQEVAIKVLPGRVSLSHEPQTLNPGAEKARCPCTRLSLAAAASHRQKLRKVQLVPGQCCHAVSCLLLKATSAA